MKHIVCFGPGPSFKGGISNYNTALAKALARQPGTKVHIVSWTQQYPAIIPRDFVDRKSQQNFLEGTDIGVVYLTNYNNPFSWEKTARHIAALKPDLVVIQWAIALQGLPLGYIARRIRRLSASTEVVFDVHVLVQKEASVLDRWFSKFGLRHASNYIAHAYQTANELKALLPEIPFSISENGERTPQGKTIIKLFHPVYDLFQRKPDFDVAAARRQMGLNDHVFLFFGFIRKYKGLHHVIPAFAKLLETRKDVSLLIVGESFWQTLDQTKWSTRIKNALFGFAKKLVLRNSDDERHYNPLALIDALGIRSHTVVVNEFVPNEEVFRYFQVSDCILTFYQTATPSGVESLAYNFELPVLATRVGHFPETIQDGYNGYLAEPENVDDMAAQMARFIEHPIARAQVAAAASHMSWDRYALALLKK